MSGIGVGDPFSPEGTTTPLFPTLSQTSTPVLTPGLTTAPPSVQSSVQPPILTPTTPTPPTPSLPPLLTSSKIVTVTKSNNSLKSTISSTAATLIITNPSVQNGNSHNNTLNVAAIIFGIMIGLIIFGGCISLVFVGKKVPKNKKKKTDITQRNIYDDEINGSNGREERIIVHSQINSISPPLNLPPPPPRRSPPLPLPPLPIASSPPSSPTSSPTSSPPPPPTPPPQHPLPLPPQNPSVSSYRNPPLTRSLSKPPLTRNSTNPSLTRSTSSPFLTLARSTSNPYITRNPSNPYITRTPSNPSRTSLTRNHSLVGNYFPEHTDPTSSNNYYQRYSSLRSQSVNHNNVEVLPPPTKINEDINEPP